MADGFYTLIIVPHARARFRKIRVPIRLVRWGIPALGFLAAFGLVSLVYVTRVSWEVYSLRQLRTENASLVRKTREYEEKQGLVQARLHQLEGLVTKLGVMAGLEKVLPDSALGGVGGALNIDTVSPTVDPHSLEDATKTISDLESRSKHLESFFADQRVLLASTPSIWPVRGYLSASFGHRIDPFTGQRDFHSGIDISTPSGTKIVAPADGVIVSSGTKGGYGNTLIIDHGFGIVTRYGHMASFNVRAGQRIHRGDVIGFVGSTGRSTAPHLHYEVWVRDQAQNPIQFILDEYRSFG
jgi:murein DD-endopeptidase MepM/ murein hydrolase activator NlpD